MNIIKLGPASLYPENADTARYVSAGGREHHTAYLVLGRIGDQAIYIEGQGVEKAAAIEHLVRQIKLVREGIDVSLHGAFWQFYEDQMDKKREGAMEMLRGLGLAGPEMPKAKKEEEEPS